MRQTSPRSRRIALQGRRAAGRRRERRDGAHVVPIVRKAGGTNGIAHTKWEKTDVRTSKAVSVYRIDWSHSRSRSDRSVSLQYMQPKFWLRSSFLRILHSRLLATICLLWLSSILASLASLRLWLLRLSSILASLRLRFLRPPSILAPLRLRLLWPPSIPAILGISPLWFLWSSSFLGRSLPPLVRGQRQTPWVRRRSGHEERCPRLSRASAPL
jgi:hypothetical protein